MKKLIFLVGLITAFTFLFGNPPLAQAGNAKVQICHFPPGNPGNFHTITVSENAVATHIDKHGDFLDTCDEFEMQECGDGDACTIDAFIPGTIDCDPNHPPVDCDDQTSCTDDSCDSATGCQYDPAITCEESDSCTMIICNGSLEEPFCDETPIVMCEDGFVCIPETGECFDCTGDTTPPSITCPADVTFECDNIGDPGEATATDNCTAVPSVTSSDVPTPGACPQEENITRTWKTTDGCGNESSCEQTITIEDTTAPQITCPADVTFECDSIGDPGEATATDNCTAVPSVTSSDAPTPGACPQEETITSTWTTTDDCGNESSCEQTITVDDTTPPQITCPAPVEVQCIEDVPTANFSDGTADDNCDPSVTVVHVGDVSDGHSPPTITRTWKTTDGCGNESSCEQTITIIFDECNG